MKEFDDLDVRIRPFLLNIKYERWSREHAVKKMYKTMTYNLTESLNAAIVHARELPITALLMHLHDLQQEYSYKHRKISTDTVTTLATNHEDLLFQNYINSLKLQVKPSTNDIITVLERGQKYTVNIKERTCTCKKFEIEEIPCQHAVAVITRGELNHISIVQDTILKQLCWRLIVRLCIHWGKKKNELYHKESRTSLSYHHSIEQELEGQKRGETNHIWN
ncbi:uncharacterized protein LOC126671564 [Mercurialis annua]|uniref:uncharacterized protein LOC126671564 n=1 Tax=Mercurialis annua TaxID=3986 RepID=UPI00215EBBCB|nr:uncharacterized protein LOC126671564 [Mercurialis annua]